MAWTQLKQVQNTPIGQKIFLFMYALALFSSALLLFLIQPMAGKILLPKLGGTPQVWATCMVFFQAVLFAGYLHAHFPGKWFGLRTHAAVHLGLAAAALLTMPVGLALISDAPDSGAPFFWLMKVLMVSIGVPMFIISSTAPLLQKWFAHTRHPAAHDPYFLYVSSNLGSLLALLSYPVVIEPFIDLGSQVSLWSIGFEALVIMLAVCFLLFNRNYVAIPTRGNAEINATTPDRLTNLQRLRWLLLSFAPSSLLLGVTSYVTTDIAAVPLFWIVPLALYLLTFVVAFSRRPPIPHHFALRAQAILLTLLVVLVFMSAAGPWWMIVPVHVLAFFTTGLVCHGELARSRPTTHHLTEFYMWMSLGGVLGGAFNALLAPAVFDHLVEYPLVLTLACLLRPSPDLNDSRLRGFDVLLPVGLAATVLISTWAATLVQNAVWQSVCWGVTLTLAGIGLLSFSDRHVRFGIGVAATLAGSTLVSIITPLESGFGAELSVQRSFFGIYKVYDNERHNMNLLMHGSTLHGAQSRDPRRAREQALYYHWDGSFGDLFRGLANRLENRSVAVIGLGAGELACYGTRGSAWTFYEIDPLVEKIARDSRYFTYLRDCPPKIQVVLGDARLTMRGAPDGAYALIILDAFSSDAVPTHLLTREAIAGYLQKLAPDGVLALHISNRHMDLVPVVGNLAKDMTLVGRIGYSPRLMGYSPRLSADTKGFATPAIVALLSRREADLGSIATDSNWHVLPTRPKSRVWSDNYINILEALRFRE